MVSVNDRLNLDMSAMLRFLPIVDRYRHSILSCDIHHSDSGQYLARQLYRGINFISGSTVYRNGLCLVSSCRW